MRRQHFGLLLSFGAPERVAGDEMRRIGRAAVLFLIAVGLPTVALAEQHRIGIGYHYWRATRDLGVDNLDRDGHSTVVSYQYLMGLVRVEADLEIFPNGFGGSTEKAYAPQGYLLIGRFLYAGVGVGLTESGGFEHGSWSGPWYAAKGGVDLIVLPRIHLDLNANYRANAFRELKHTDSGAWTLGATVRIGI
jgi:hypothetical protein